jgi:hypothetical protein
MRDCHNYCTASDAAVAIRQIEEFMPDGALQVTDPNVKTVHFSGAFTAPDYHCQVGHSAKVLGPLATT